MTIPQETRREAYEKAIVKAPKTKELILQCLKAFGPQTVSDVAARMGKQRHTIAGRFTELQGEGIIADVGKKNSPLGCAESIYSAEPPAPRADGSQYVFNLGVL